MRLDLPAALVLLALAGCAPEPPSDGGIGVVDALGGSEADPGFARATGQRTFRFPADHGPHPAYRNEWWYLTGNLEDPLGHRYGFQVTFFRIGLDPDPPDRASEWATSQVWMAHAAITDAQAGRHLAAERFARDALGLAGARAAPFRVWLGPWTLESRGEGFPWHLELDAEAFRLALRVSPLKPPVLQGEDGLSRKSSEPGAASYYYSLTRLAAEGTLEIEGRERTVEGLAWLDREWGSRLLGEDQAGWDWLSLQLDDGRDLMFYRLRRTDGSTDPHSTGVLVSAEGGRRRLTDADLSLEPMEHWSAAPGERYPVAWRLEGAALDRPLRVEAVLKDQLMRVSVRYWEGAVDVLDAATGDSLGRGYLEMTGYAGDGGTPPRNSSAQAP